MFNRTRFVIAAAAAAAATMVYTALAVTDVSAAPAATADEQPSLAEDYSYPGGNQILADYRVQLTSGDGHILFAECPTGPDTVGLIQVTAASTIGQHNDGHVCFHVIAPTGRLTMKIPGVFSIRGDGVAAGQGHKLKAELTTDAGQHSTVDVNPSGTTQVGIGANPTGEPTTLLQLDASL
ncbi:hypothetical protein OG943_22150 [Amycolatopsis sp. NBC_00345]|uniref:hypothetical protein n=1 Tax=Amycolatopsis sp. NBC_00345 TaxID=2975955 RepID=UPI002E26919D